VHFVSILFLFCFGRFSVHPAIVLSHSAGIFLFKSCFCFQEGCVMILEKPNFNICYGFPDWPRKYSWLGRTAVVSVCQYFGSSHSWKDRTLAVTECHCCGSAFGDCSWVEVTKMSWSH